MDQHEQTDRPIALPLLLGLVLGIGVLAIGPCRAHGAEHRTVKAAKAAAEKDEMPLVVYIGAPWCPHCRAMKANVLPVLKRDGDVDKVAFVELDYDQSTAVAKALMRGETTIPQVLVFRKPDAPGKWKREALIGGQTVESVREVLAER